MWMKTRGCRWTNTAVDRSAAIRLAMGTAASTPPPGVYNTPVGTMGVDVPGGKLSAAPRFVVDRAAAATPGPAAYDLNAAARLNNKGTDFSRAPAGRVLSSGSYFPRTRLVPAAASASGGAPIELPSRDTPGPGSYVDDSRAAFRAGPTAGALSQLAASNLSRRIPADPTVRDAAVLRDAQHVLDVSAELLRHRLRG
jgi:hypothetical protein